ncbi:helix-turn-helix domain-containing protein [Thermomicrobiaceae bacterium CFH 74404]|uniref:Helix-turn-helix domain-containing protein n=1 Tax=Thermalbibacter longus TaxID=2951981 RepID=A0AA41WCL3_9BACT|nr:helix-turn-helix domain-containing protein [Thermalbibacter longus]MCM8750402.1 helix-turn-helix domain-containing protein [Thermalbibacter longus]
MSGDTDTRETLTVEEVARVFGIGRQTAYDQARTGRIGPVPVYRIGRRLVVPRRALERALAGELTEQEGQGHA